MRPLVLPPVPDVQHRVPLLRHQPLRLVAVHEAHLRADGDGGDGGPPQGQAAAAPPGGAIPEPYGYPRTSAPHGIGCSERSQINNGKNEGGKRILAHLGGEKAVDRPRTAISVS